MKQAVIVTGWFISTIATLMVSISTIHLVRKPRQVSFQPVPAHYSPPPLFAGSNQSNSVLGITNGIVSADARPILIERFLERYHSPLKPYDYWGKYLVQIADRYHLDFRLLPAMAMQESNLCKKIPSGSYNCLGLGIHSQGTWGFESYETNFAKAAEILKKNYIDKGLVTPEQIQTKYTPHSNGSWQFAVNQFIRKIDQASF